MSCKKALQDQGALVAEALQRKIRKHGMLMPCTYQHEMLTSSVETRKQHAEAVLASRGALQRCSETGVKIEELGMFSHELVVS